MYETIKKMLNEANISEELKREIDKIFEKLYYGLKIQESSSNMMSCMVQDLLDYAQIRSGKFRKTIKLFNIRETVEKVMCIQRS